MILSFVVACLIGCGGIGIGHESALSLRIAATTLPSGTPDTNYVATLSATGGAPPYSWGIVSGRLPDGLTLEKTTGTISGTPSLSGVFSVVTRVQDSRAFFASKSIAIRISALPTPAISTVIPDSGPINGGTEVTISGTNFRPGAQVRFGNLNAAAYQVVSSTQIRAVTPVAPVGSVGVTVEDSENQIAAAGDSFTFVGKVSPPPVTPPLQITTASLLTGSVQSRYTSTLAASGGVPPYSWSLAGGQLPSGLALNPATGAITGVPTIAGAFPVSTKVTDSKTNSATTDLSLHVSTAPAPAISTISPSSGATAGGTTVTVSGSNFASGMELRFGGALAQSVRVVSSTEIQAVTPSQPSGKTSVTAQASDGQIAAMQNAFTFVAPPPTAPSEPPAVTADVVVDAGQTVSETGGDDLAAAKNIFASASSPESNGGLSDWSLISSELTMRRMRIINGLGDCALDPNGNLTGCSRLNDNLAWVKQENLTPHVIVGQWAPPSIPGDPRQWGDAQWAQYDALCYAVVNYVVNQYGGSGFNEALFEVGNELDTTTNPQDLWLTTTPNVPQGDSSRFTQFDTVYTHWASAVSQVAQNTPSKKVQVGAPATGFWTAYYGSGQLWHNQIVQKYAAQSVRLDVVSLHIYTREVNDLARYAQSIRQTLNANGNSHAQIWVTEWGPSDSTDSYYGAINGSHEGAAWVVQFLLQALKGTVTGGAFLSVRDNQGGDTVGTNSNMFLSSWHHVENSIEYPKAATNALSMVSRMTGTRKSATVNTAKPDLRALSSSDSSSASLVVGNYNYLFDYDNRNYGDQTTNESVTVGFKNLPFSGHVVVDRYLIDAKTSNLAYWVAAGKVPPSVQATQLQKVDSFSGNSVNGTLSLPATDMSKSAVSLWVVHQ